MNLNLENCKSEKSKVDVFKNLWSKNIIVEVQGNFFIHVSFMFKTKLSFYTLMKNIHFLGRFYDRF